MSVDLSLSLEHIVTIVTWDLGRFRHDCTRGGHTDLTSVPSLQARFAWHSTSLVDRQHLVSRSQNE